MAAKVEIYTTSTCGYCRAALALLRKLEVTFTQHDVTGKPDVRAWLVQQTGRTTVPQIFIGGRAIGGFDDLAALHRGGALAKLIAANDSA
ncbi:MAG: glutaredoxin 3 [Myxococcales bacterium]|nr:glutaredoxin 3 [Myxococcales bacterium]